MVLVARALDEGALRVIKPIPYLFEKLIRRQYREVSIADDINMEQVVLHSVVGAALLRPHDMETLIQDASTPAGPKT